MNNPGAVKAYVLINIQAGYLSSVLRSVRELSKEQSLARVEADAVTGSYDIIAVIEQDGLNALTDIIANHIQIIPGVTRTITCLVLSLKS